jgi:hypothetical protein
MSAGKYSFTIEQGATLNFEIQYRDGNGVPVDLTGYTGFMQIRSGYSGSAGTVTYLTFNPLSGSQYTTNPQTIDGAYISFSGSNLTTTPESGSIGIYAGWGATQGLTFTGNAYYDLEITSGSIRTRLLEGLVQLDQQVTLQ